MLMYFLDTVPTSPTRTGGAGLQSYLDSIHKECDALNTNTEGCADAINNYMEAVSSGSQAPSVDGAKAIGSYLDALSCSAPRQGGAGIPTYLDSVPTASNRQGGSGIGNYQDSVGSAPAVMNHLNNLSSGASPAPPANAVNNLIKDVSTGAASGSGISSYLNTVSVTSSRVGGAGIPSFQNMVPTNPSCMSGAGITSYLDTIQKECNAISPTENCAPAIANYMDAVLSGNALSSVNEAKAIGSYLDALARSAPHQGGAGIPAYLDSVPT